VPILEGALFFPLAPEHFIVPVRVERRIDVDQIDARIRERSEPIEAIAAVDDPSIEEGRGSVFYAQNL
jgi:hypothetical protein